MSEKDKLLTYASLIIGGDVVITREAYEGLQQRVVAALTAVRKEARAAAFKESMAIIVGQPVAHYIYSGSQPMAAETFRDNAVRAIEATVAIEAARNQRAAANTEVKQEQTNERQGQ